MATTGRIVSVCKSNTAQTTETIEWQISAWSSLPSGHVAEGCITGAEATTSSETIVMQAAGE